MERTIRKPREPSWRHWERDPQVGVLCAAVPDLRHAYLGGERPAPSLLCGIDPERERKGLQDRRGHRPGGPTWRAGSAGQAFSSAPSWPRTLEVGFGRPASWSPSAPGPGAAPWRREMFPGRRDIPLQTCATWDAGRGFSPIWARRRKLSGLDAEVHEIALHFDDIAMAGDPGVGVVGGATGRTANEILSWKELLPLPGCGPGDVELFPCSYLGTILFAVVALTIVNTLQMSLYERMFRVRPFCAPWGTRPRQAGPAHPPRGVLPCPWVSGRGGERAGIGGGPEFFAEYGIDYVGIEMAGVDLAGN